MFTFIFGEYRQFIIQIASGEQYIFYVRETEVAKLCCEPLFVFAGVMQVVLHDMTVKDEGGCQISA